MTISATQRSIRHDIGEFPRGRDDEEEDDVFERGFRVDCGRTAAEKEEGEEREGRKRDRVTFWDFSRAI